MFYILLGILLGIIIYNKIIKRAKYWEERDVIHEPPWPIVGNMGEVLLRKKHLMDKSMELHRKYPGHRYVGIMMFSRPMLMIRDLQLIKQLTIKDFEYFHDHFIFAKVENNPVLSKSLISLNGQDWRQMRSALSPVFTSAKMRTMYQLVSDCAEKFVGHFKGKEQVAIDMREVLSRFATDIIATTAFGIRVDSMKEPDNSFFTMGTRLNRGAFLFLKTLVASKLSFLANWVGAEIFPKDVTNFFRSIVKDNIDKREKNEIVCADLIQLLMKARKGKLIHDPDRNKNEGFATVEESCIGQSTRQLKLTNDDIVAQAMLFFFAGFETVSTASCFLAHELAVHPDVQEKLQEEIDGVMHEHKGKIPYETLLSMKYLDQVVSESLRLWPPAIQTDRVCTKDYTVQPRNSDEKKVLLKEGEDSILIPVSGIHRDPQYYPEPEKFDPERFSDENKWKIVPGSYLPFGAGPRNCIGSRFAPLEIKTFFFHLLSKFDIVAISVTQTPIKLDHRKISLTPENGFKLGFRPRKVTFY